jgi:hypothetical protein
MDDTIEENQQPMNERAVKLLRAASELVGGDKVLAQRLGISEALLDRLMSGQYELPERVLFGTVGIILANQESHHSFPQLGVKPVLKSTSDG